MDGQRERLPRNYALIREIVANGSSVHWTATDIYRAARERQPSIGLATVHRGLTRLCELGALLKIDVSSGGAAWYEPPAPTHAHLLCEQCGAIVDVAYATSPEDLAAIARRDGLRIAAEIVTFRGLCRECTAKTAALPAPLAMADAR